MYVVLEYTGTNANANDVVDASCATSLPLELGFHASNASGVRSFSVHGGLARAKDLFEEEPLRRISQDELDDLKACVSMLRFLRSATSALLRQALVEPQLIKDLREC